MLFSHDYFQFQEQIYWYLLYSGVEIDTDGTKIGCKLNRADFISLSKQLNIEKNREIKQKLGDMNGLPNLGLITAKHNDANVQKLELEDKDQKTTYRRDMILPSIQLLSRATANALRQLFDQKEKQAAW